MSRTMVLAELLPDVAGIPPALEVGGLVQDSRELRPGDAFVAIGGFGSHGLGFAAQARAAGAAAILFEPPAPDALPPPAGAIAVPRLRARLGELGHRFHGCVSEAMTVVGVTGTNGKTSIVQLLAQAWELRGTRSGTIGTLGAGLYGQTVATGFTTPLVLRLHALLAQLHADGAQAMAMEVSSHALDQGRVDGVRFDIAVFTNLTRDHLDYHGDMAAYGEAKMRLFRWSGLKAAVVNLDDEFGDGIRASLLAAEASDSSNAAATASAPFTPTLSHDGAAVGGEGVDASSPSPAPGLAGADHGNAFAPSPPLAGERGASAAGASAVALSENSIQVIGLSSRGNPAAAIRAEQIELDDTGISFDLIMNKQHHRVRSPLLGRFNVDNLLGVAGALHALGTDTADIAVVLSLLRPVHGRMNRLGGDGQPLVVIDYAHTPDALKQALASLRAHASARLVCVFGCGGERDSGKRPQMAAVAEAHADRIIVTDDNPRGESGDVIVSGILAGFRHPQQVLVQRDRAAAIACAIGAAGAGDVVLIAGKGHELHQEVADVRLPFDDTAVARKCLEARA